MLWRPGRGQGKWVGGCGVSMSGSWDYNKVLGKVGNMDASFRCLWLCFLDIKPSKYCAMMNGDLKSM